MDSKCPAFAGHFLNVEILRRCLYSGTRTNGFAVNFQRFAVCSFVLEFCFFVALCCFCYNPNAGEGSVCGLEAGQCPLLRVFYVLQCFNRRTSNRCGFVAALKTGLRKRECDFCFLSGRAGSAESNVRLADVVSLRLPQVPERSGVRPQAGRI